MIKLIIFDLDGTLVDAFTAVCQSVNFTLKSLGLPERPCDEIKRRVGKGDLKLLEHFAGAKLAKKAIIIYRPHHAKALKAKGAVKLLPGVLPALRFLKKRGVKLAIASNRPTKFTRLILKELGILTFFKVVLCADRAPRPKPWPDILWTILKQLHASKEESLYVGDMDIDVRCGRRAGLRVVAVATGSSSKNELKDLKPFRIIDKMVKLKPLLKESK